MSYLESYLYAVGQTFAGVGQTDMWNSNFAEFVNENQRMIRENLE